MTGLSISLAYALVLVVVLEIIAGRDGIGYLVMQMRNSIRTTDMFASVVSLGIVGYVLNWLFVTIDARIMAWHKALVAKEIF